MMIARAEHILYTVSRNIKVSTIHYNKLTYFGILDDKHVQYASHNRDRRMGLMGVKNHLYGMLKNAYSLKLGA